ncbi:MAG: hypothetical protein K0S44_1981 [Bacteroidetes bacterium]|jgi:hypothetical protein|nr:hypothetical protein [Bacteroidota bacterium]
MYLIQNLYAQKDSIKRKEYEITRASKTPKLDGMLDDEAWINASVINTFLQNYPVEKAPSSQRTHVRLVYDNTAIYISAKLYDTAPDSIRKQLGNRDDNVNADVFRIVFDTYNTQQDAFDFSVTASGVQLDSKFSDAQYNAVWESAIRIETDGWNVEMKIPYSAIRFPNSEKQIWGLQVTRSIARNNEFVQWGLTPRGASNGLFYWGIMKGLDNVKEPVRLSLTPYITAYTSHYPTNIKGESNYTANITGGMDLKYGINESFTVDATLLPDFTQVQSDNIVKNLSAFEVQYAEQRPFFQESIDLFQKGGLFYSRRIGRRPGGYYNAYYQTNPETKEVIVKNPDQAKLLNATKISGRTTNGLGVGILNAVLDDTYAIARDSMGNERKILTEPFSNYNIIVFDQQMKNSSNMYIINTNVNRQRGYNNSNVTGFGTRLNNKKNTYAVSADASITNVFTPDTAKNSYTDVVGHNYFLTASKTSGNFQFTLFREGINPTYQNNDMGYNRETNYICHGMDLSFNQFKPFGRFLNAGLGINVRQFENYTTHRLNSVNIELNSYATFKSFDNINFGGDWRVTEQIDYYEPRTPGRILIRPRGLTFWGGLNTDSRKRFRVNLNIYAGSTEKVTATIGYNPYFGINLSPSIRFSDKFSLYLSSNYSKDLGDRGYVNKDAYGNIIFGVRFLTNVTNTIEARYLFRNNLSLGFRARHYWARGDYRSFYNLTEEGRLIDNISYDQNHDFNFNAFNIDMVFQWQFAPGSFMNIVWKNSIYNEGNSVINSYSENLNNTFEAKQLNTISLKVIYFFDYLYLRKKHENN